MALGLRSLSTMLAGVRRTVSTNRSFASSSDEADPTVVASLIDGYRCSKVLFTAVELKLFDHLTGPALTLDELAEKLTLPHPSALERFLNACIALQLIRRDPANRKYSNTKTSEKYLVSSSPATLNGYIDHNNHSSYHMWNHLPTALRENAPQWQRTFDTIKKEPFTFDTHYRDDGAEALFMSGMHGFGLVSFPSIIGSIDDMHQYRTFCDLGGATGCLAVSACEANAHLQAIIFDLPRIEKHARSYLERAPSAIRDRIRFHGGDFFRDELPAVDLFGLGRVLHDWNDEQCLALLEKIYRRLPNQNGALLLAEKLLETEKTGPLSANMQDLNMLLATLGRERSGEEYRKLLEKVGFKNVKCYHTGTGLDGIVAYK